MMKSVFIVIVLALGGCGNPETVSPGVQEYTGADYTIFQTDSVRTYFSYHYSGSLNGFEDSVAVHRAFYEKQLADLGPYFREGQITGEMFHQALNQPTQNVENSDRSTKISPGPASYGESLNQEMQKYDGPLLKILLIESRDTLDYTQYFIYATTDRTEDGWGGMLKYSIYVRDRRVFRFSYNGLEL